MTDATVTSVENWGGRRLEKHPPPRSRPRPPVREPPSIGQRNPWTRQASGLIIPPAIVFSGALHYRDLCSETGPVWFGGGPRAGPDPPVRSGYDVPRQESAVFFS